jgi:peptide/nickel transport system substrate-binding protein
MTDSQYACRIRSQYDFYFSYHPAWSSSFQHSNHNGNQHTTDFSPQHIICGYTCICIIAKSMAYILLRYTIHYSNRCCITQHGITAQPYLFMIASLFFQGTVSMYRSSVCHICCLALLLLPIIVYAHEGEAGHQHTTPTYVIDRNAVHIVGPWELTGLDPSRAGYMFTRMEVTETLVDVDDKGQLIAGLATHWSASSDLREWRFTLRPNSLFHDGTPVTASNVVTALERAWRIPGVLHLATINGIRADGTTIIVTLDTPFALLPYLFTHTTTQILAPASFDHEGTVVQVIGSGPYRITQLRLPQGFSVARFDNRRQAFPHQPLPQIERAHYTSVSRSETRTLLVQSNQADMAFSLDAASVRQLQQSKHTLLSAPLPRTTFIKVNAGHPWLQDQRVRQAISLGIEREGIAQALMRDKQLAATQLFPPTMVRWHQTQLPPLPTNIAKARQLLEQAGWHVGSDGIRTRNGERFALTLLTYVDRPELPVIATAIQEEMRQIGIAVRVVIGNSSDIPAGHRSGTLQLALVARNFGNLPDPTATVLLDFSATGADWGAMHWHDDQAIQALQQLITTCHGIHQAASQQSPHYLVAQALQNGLPVIPVVWYAQHTALSRRISNASIDPYERSYRLSQLVWNK